MIHSKPHLTLTRAFKPDQVLGVLVVTGLKSTLQFRKVLDVGARFDLRRAKAVLEDEVVRIVIPPFATATTA
jgi:hypothetical protein